MKIVKISIDYISSPLTHIFNLCISEGIFPQKMKNSKINPYIKIKTNTNHATTGPYQYYVKFQKYLKK